MGDVNERGLASDLPRRSYILLRDATQFLIGMDL